MRACWLASMVPGLCNRPRPKENKVFKGEFILIIKMRYSSHNSLSEWLPAFYIVIQYPTHPSFKGCNLRESLVLRFHSHHLGHRRSPKILRFHHKKLGNLRDNGTLERARASKSWNGRIHRDCRVPRLKIPGDSRRRPRRMANRPTSQRRTTLARRRTRRGILTQNLQTRLPNEPQRQRERARRWRWRGRTKSPSGIL